MSDKKFKVGDKVRYIGKDHKEMPEFYPEIGTVGTIMKKSGDTNWYIQWPKGSTVGNDRWWATNKCIELVKDDVTTSQKTADMTNEEIWEMLESKMCKNGLKKKMGALYCDNKLTNGYWVYTPNDVHNAIAIAYRSGYERAMKGRPFKFGEKKKKCGHWEPVDPNNLPKEGTRVKYSRECEDYADSDGCICINDTGAIKLEGSWFGVTLDNPHRYKWICFDNAEDCLDMWVEDDE